MAEALPPLSQDGMFELPLRASYSMDKGRFTHRIAVLEEWLIGQEQCHQNAIHNLIGVLQFYMGNSIKALSHFKTVLNNDPMNLNALGNSSFVYRRLGRSSKALEMENHLREANAQGEPTLSVLQGRYWAEQAHALSSEIIGGTRHENFDLESNKFYDFAFKIAGRHFQETELGAWQFSAAINYRRLLMKWDTPETSRRESFSRSLELFCKAKATPNSRYIADCWCQIGMLMNGIKGGNLYLEAVPPPVKTCELERYYRNPEECYLKTLELQPSNWHFVNKYVRFLLNKSHKPDRLLDALQRMRESLRLQPDQSNWFGYSTRAEICRKLYFKGNAYLLQVCKRICDLLGWNSEVKPYMKKFDEHGNLDAARRTEVVDQLRHDLLVQADDDIRKVLAWNTTTKGFLICGQISYDIACSEKRQGLQFEERMEQALEMF